MNIDKDRLLTRTCHMVHEEWGRLYGCGMVGYLYNEYEVIKWLADAIINNNTDNIDMYNKAVVEGDKYFSGEELYIAKWFIRKAEQTSKVEDRLLKEEDDRWNRVLTKNLDDRGHKKSLEELLQDWSGESSTQ